MNTSKISIIGAGIGGCFLAILLAKKGLKVHIYERFSQEETTIAASKRSYNLTLYEFAIEALKKADLWSVVEPIIVPLAGSVTQVTPTSDPIFYNFGFKNVPYFSVDRAGLLNTLLQQAKKSPLIIFHFSTRLTSIDRDNKTIQIENLKSGKSSTITCNVIFGADGVNSTVREYMQQGQQAQLTKEYATWEYKQIPLSKNTVEKLSLRNDAMHAWTRKQAIFTAFPNIDHTFNAQLILPKNSEKGFSYLDSAQKIEQFLNDSFPKLLAAKEEIIYALLEYPIGKFVSLVTNPWYYKDFMVILGDAAHGFFPFFGQGTSAAFADGLTLSDLIDEHNVNWEKIFPLYQEKRKKHTDVITELSKEAFFEYTRHKKADYTAIYSRFELLLYKLFPTIINKPLFLLVFSDPSHAADHFEKYKKQRKLFAVMGFSLLVGTVTGLVALKEKFYTPQR